MLFVMLVADAAIFGGFHASSPSHAVVSTLNSWLPFLHLCNRQVSILTVAVR